jgi:putative ATP-dependent endonuclease of the OLD family
MHLAFASVACYRGIRSLALPLGPTTTLIGENAYGKSNLLDALLVCLGVGAAQDEFAFLPGDFWCRGKEGSPPRPNGNGEEGPDDAEPIVIRLGFRESTPGEWEEDAACAPLRDAVYAGPRGDRRITLELTARLERDGAGAASVRVAKRFTRGDDAPDAPAGADAVRLLRSRVPLILLKADRYFVRPSRVPAAPGPERAEDRIAAEISATFASVSDQHRPIDRAELRRGVEAAEAYVLRFGGERLKQRLRRFLDPDRAPGGTGLSSAARSIALLLVLGAMLDARSSSAFAPEAKPVLAIEDAEAYLHPVILASVAALIEAIPTQKLVTTNSGELLSMLPLASLRRIVARAERTDVHRLRRDTLTEDELRRIGYHVRANRGASLFARCWLLVEGETEFWLLPEFAELCGHDFALEGVRCMEFAQCGIAPLVKLADDLGIGWHLLADGDRSGQSYASAARSFLEGRSADRHVTMMAERDVEHLLWDSGYADVYRSAIPSAAPRRFDRRPRTDNPTPTIERAIRARSKPGMALEIVEAARREGSPGVPPTLRAAIERSVDLARASIAER